MRLARLTAVLAGCAAALLAAGSAAAQPAPGTPADAEATVVRLVEAVHARDWLALAAFVDTTGAQGLSNLFPATAEEALAQLSAMIGAEGTDVDSLFAAADDPAARGPASTARRYRRLLDVLYADGPQGQTALTARMLALAARCDSDSALSRIDAVRYTPVRALVRADGTVEVIGRVSVPNDGEMRDELTVVPLRWANGRWMSDTAPTEARDTEGDPLTAVIRFHVDILIYALVSVVGSDPSGPLPACLVGGE